MKLKARKVTLSAKEVDQLGQSYCDARIAAKNITEEIAGICKDIKSVASKLGTERGNKVVVRGKRFEVGYIEVAASPSLDTDLVKKVLAKKPHLLREVMTLQIDPAKVEALVRSKKIKSAEFLKMCTLKGGGERVYVRDTVNNPDEEENEG